ncbi:MAG: lytic murein transglycosylase B [Herbaspirillum sp.]
MPELIHAESTPARQKTRATDAGQFSDFSQWQEVSTFIDDMVTHNGFDKAALQIVFSKARHLDTVIQLIGPVSGDKPKNWRAYRARFVEPRRIDAGVDFWNEHEPALSRAEAQYGVPAEIIVGIIGVETVYGRNTGDFRVMDAITTLAFNYPKSANHDARTAFFRKELESTLLLARESHIDPFSLSGSYAGAIGWPQFMPSSIRRYAIDFDGDGKIDLCNSPVDAIGSVASFLKMHGWQRGAPTVFPATITDGSKIAKLIDQGLEAKFTPDELKAAGIMPDAELPAGLHYGVVDLQNGAAPPEHWLATNNFFAITRYNRSYFYAMSVIDLARAIRLKKAVNANHG